MSLLAPTILVNTDYVTIIWHRLKLLKDVPADFREQVMNFGGSTHSMSDGEATGVRIPKSSIVFRVMIEYLESTGLLDALTIGKYKHYSTVSIEDIPGPVTI